MADITRTCKTILDTLYSKAVDASDAMPSDTQKIFLSFCNGAKRALTVNGIGPSLSVAFEAAVGAALKHMESVPKWVMIDVVTNETVLTIQEYYKMLKKSRRGYMRYGVSFDESYHIAFLEQEIYGNNFLKLVNKKDQYFSSDIITNYLKKHKGQECIIETDLSKPIILFETKSGFYDEGTYTLLESSTESLYKGLRKIQLSGNRAENAALVLDIITKTADYLVSTLEKSGRFLYGYYPCFSSVIPGYNILRHALSVYSLADIYLVNPDPKYKEAALCALDYMLENYLYHHDKETAFVTEPVNDNEKEIKLGALGLTILAITKCAEITDTNYLPILRKIGNGILFFQNKETGNFTHVLHYPSLDVKEEFRIANYAGEACFALMRLYTMDRNPKWLSSVEHAFSFLIENDYHKYNDSWLSYAISELVKYKNTDKYLKFGLKNVFNDLDAIIKRDTASNTFLELLNASHPLINKIQDSGKSYLLKNYDLEKLYQTMDIRFSKQLTSIMFPEVAMFFASPETILHGIFIRHQSFRIRNDDTAHHLMGYCNYFRNNLMPKQQRWNEKISVDVTFSAGQMILGGMAENSKVSIQVKPIQNNSANPGPLGPMAGTGGSFTTDELNNMLLKEFLKIDVLVNGKSAKSGIYAQVSVDMSTFNMTGKQRVALTGVSANLNSFADLEELGGSFEGDNFQFGIDGSGIYGIMVGSTPVIKKQPQSAPPPAPKTIMRFTIGSGSYICNGKELETKEIPFVNLKNYQTMLPIRPLAQGFGARMEWIKLTGALIIYMPSRTLVLHTNSLLESEDKPVIKDDNIFVSLSYVTEKMGATVKLDGSTVIVYN